jgi:cell fate (sporulation/competence/biofilm development) regulator YlbF (YheA/YmcA/DUF963 family)
MSRTWMNVADSRRTLKDAEADGLVADSRQVRIDLMAQFHSGEKTLEQVQSELTQIKRNAKKNGQVTRDQAYLGRTP